MVRVKSILFCAIISFFSWSVIPAADFRIAVQQPLANADITTHEIYSGNVVLGVSEYGGGYINKLYIPGVGDVIGRDAARYGRGGQASIRDRLHRGRYNPTQAGFSDRAGTYCLVLKKSSELLLVPPRPCALWHGDRKYDFIEWENVAADPYMHDKGFSDSDRIDDKNLLGQQETEITSEFDFTASYENAKDNVKVKIPAFRFYYEFRFIRKPGHSIRQFSSQTANYDHSVKLTDISNKKPEGIHPSTESSLTGVILSSTLRGDKSIWDPSIIYSLDRTGKLVVRAEKKEFRNVCYENRQMFNEPLVIYSRSKDKNEGPAIGFFQPRSHINVYSITGRSLKHDYTIYEDDRIRKSFMLGNTARTRGMWLFGARTELRGLLDTTMTPEGVYETVRGESYILIGTPNEIVLAAHGISQVQ